MYQDTLYPDTLRRRTGSMSDTHIEHCDCTHCDGRGSLEIISTRYASIEECPSCEGLGAVLPPLTGAARGLQRTTTPVIHEMPSPAYRPRPPYRYAA